MYDMPLSDAVLVENGIYTRIQRIARQIEKNHADEVRRAGRLTPEIITAAIAEVQEKYGTFAGEGAGFSDKNARRRQRLAGSPSAVWQKIVSKRGGAAPVVEAKKKGRKKKAAEVETAAAAIEEALGNPFSNGFASGRFTIGRLGRRQIAQYLDASGSLKRAYMRQANKKRKFWGKSVKTSDKPASKGGQLFRKGGKPSFSVTVKGADARASKAARDALWGTEDYVLYGRSISDAEARKMAVARKLARQAARSSGTPWTHAQSKEYNLARKMDAAAFTELGRGKRGAFSKKSMREMEKYMKNNPFGYDDLALVTNPSGIGVLDNVESMVDRVPVVGEYIAPLVTPAVLGAAAFGVHYFAVPYVEKYLPTAAKPFAYTIGGSVVGIASGVVAAKAQDSSVRNAAALIGGAAVAIGVGLDLFRKYGGGKAGDADYGDADYGDDMGALALGAGVFGDEFGAGVFGDEFGAIGLDNPGVFGAIGLENPGVFGDGMAYQLGPVGGFGFDGDTSAVLAGYSGASLADAYYSGADFDGAEGEAILAGPAEFRRAAGPVPVSAAGAQSHASNLAGRRYHRWGWLVKTIGWDNTQKLAALSPAERLHVIQALRSHAFMAYTRGMAAHAAHTSGNLQPGHAAIGAMGASAAPGVGDAFGYGALAVADY